MKEKILKIIVKRVLELNNDFEQDSYFPNEEDRIPYIVEGLKKEL